jgi:hypothetical protein
MKIPKTLTREELNKVLPKYRHVKLSDLVTGNMDQLSKEPWVEVEGLVHGFVLSPKTFGKYYPKNGLSRRGAVDLETNFDYVAILSDTINMIRIRGSFGEDHPEGYEAAYTASMLRASSETGVPIIVQGNYWTAPSAQNKEFYFSDDKVPRLTVAAVKLGNLKSHMFRS